MVTNLFEFIKQLKNVILNKDLYRDAVPDTRLYIEKQKDYIYGQDVLLGFGNLGKRITKLPFEPYDQQRTSACGAHAAAHARLLSEKKTTFPLDWYRARSNYPSPGMFTKDVLSLAAHANETKVPKNRPKTLTEEYATSLPLRNLFSNKRKETYGYVQIKPFDADSVAEAVSNGYPVVVSFFSTLNEWVEEMEVREFTTVFTAPVRHFVDAIPNSLHEKDGKLWISVVDSARQGGLVLRHLSLDFLSKRMWVGGGFTYKVTSKPTETKVVPDKRCEYGQENSDVLALQEFMFANGLMDEIHMTGYYGNITAKAVLIWQLNNIKDIPHHQLIQWGGHYWGPSSIKAALKTTK